MASASDFLERLARLSHELGITTLVPGVDEELLRMPDLGALCPELDILVPPPWFVNVMIDKLTCAQAIAERGLAMPRTVTADRAYEMTYPCIVKPRQGRGSRNVMVLRTRQQVPAYLALFGGQPDAYVLQELVVGTEYTVYVSADAKCRLRSVVPIKVLEKRGITIRAEIDMQETIVRYVEALHEAFRPSGPYNIQLMLTNAGHVLPFEVNPRVSTTLCLAIAAGADPIAGYHSVSGAREPISPVPKLRLRRYWQNTIQVSVS